jgi:hypothetical protein
MRFSHVKRNQCGHIGTILIVVFLSITLSCDKAVGSAYTPNDRPLGDNRGRGGSGSGQTQQTAQGSGSGQDPIYNIGDGDNKKKTGTVPLADSPGPKAPPVNHPSNQSALLDICHINPRDPFFHDKLLKKRLKDKKGPHLIRYTLTFPEYANNILNFNDSINYKPYHWERVFDQHGKTLLTLVYNYDILSMSLLSVGVEEMEVPLIDSPQNCFGKLSSERKFITAKRLVLNDFLSGQRDTDYQWAEEEFACHQVMKKQDDDYATFEQECCQKQKEGRNICIVIEPETWTQIVHILIISLKVLFLMFSPLLFIQIFYVDSIRTTDYVVRLKEALRKTMLVKKVKVHDESHASSSQREMREFRKFRRRVKDIPADKIVTLEFKKLHVVVDHRHLVPEDRVPVGLWRFLYENLIRCHLCRMEPLAACCR